MTDPPALFEKVRCGLNSNHADEQSMINRKIARDALNKIATGQHVIVCECVNLRDVNPHLDPECAALREACRGEKR